MKQAVFVILLVLNSFVFAGYMFCAVGYDGEFAYIDPSTGQVDLIYTNAGYRFQSLAKSPDGTMYAATTDSSIHAINPQTGEVGGLVAQWSNYSFTGMAVSPDSQIYVSSNYYFYAYDSQLGFARNLGLLWGAVYRCSGLAFSPDGVLYGITSSGSYDSYKLVTIDLSTLKTSLIGSFSNTAGIAGSIVFTEDGSLYAVGRDFAQLDPADGSIIGDVIEISGIYSGLELIPEPATVFFLGFGFYYIAGKRKSKF